MDENLNPKKPANGNGPLPLPPKPPERSPLFRAVPVGYFNIGMAPTDFRLMFGNVINGTQAVDDILLQMTPELAKQFALLLTVCVQVMERHTGRPIPYNAGQVEQFRALYEKQFPQAGMTAGQEPGLARGRIAPTPAGENRATEAKNAPQGYPDDDDGEL